LTSWFLQKVGHATGRIRRIAIVALARKPMIALWRYVTIGLISE
jgi:transposase